MAAVGSGMFEKGLHSYVVCKNRRGGSRGWIWQSILNVMESL